MFEMEAVTLLGVNDLQKYNTNNKATFYILFCCRCWPSFVVLVCGRKDWRDVDGCLMKSVCSVYDDDNDSAMTTTTDDDYNDFTYHRQTMITTTARVYLYKVTGANRSHHQQ